MPPSRLSSPRGETVLTAKSTAKELGSTWLPSSIVGRSRSARRRLDLALGASYLAAMSRRALIQIRKLILEGSYEFTEHAWEEAANDELDRIDIESAVLTGAIDAVQKDEPREPKYVIRGFATDLSRQVGVVLRIRRRRTCVIITVYEITEA